MKTMTGGSLALVAGLALAGCGAAQADGADDAAQSADFVRVINVEVVTVTAETFVEDIRLTSVAMANQDVMVSTEEGGVVRALFVDRGEWISEGDPIAKIDDRVLATQVTQARAGAELASQTWDRRKRLWEEDRAGSEIAYLESRFAAEQSAATLAGLEERLARTVVRAPFSGVFDERHVDVGAMLSPGQSVGRLVDLDPIKVFAGVPERYAADIRVGAPAQLRFEALGAQVFEAPVRYVSAVVNPQSRTFPVEVELPNPNRSIKPQMVANMSLSRRQVDDAIVVPQDALVRVENGYAVFVVGERDGVSVARERAVTLGPSRSNLVVVEAGLALGERLVVVGQKSVADGDRIRVVGEGE